MLTHLNIFILVLILSLSSYAQRSDEIKDLTKAFRKFRVLDIDSAKAILTIQESKAKTQEDRFEVAMNFLDYYFNLGNDVKIAKQVDRVRALSVSAKQADDELKINYFDHLGRYFFSINEQDSAIVKYKHSLSLAKKDTSNKYYISLLYYRLVGCYGRLQDRKSERAYLDSCLAIAESGVRAKAYNVLGGMYYQENKLDSAIFCLEEASEILLSKGDVRSSLNTRINVANIYKSQAKFQKVADILNDVIVQAKKEKYDYPYYMANLNALEVWVDLGLCDSVLRVGPQLAFYYESEKREPYLPHIFTPMARCELRQGNHEKAKKLLLDGLKIQDNIGDSSHNMFIYAYLGRAYEYSDLGTAIYYLNRALKLSIKAKKISLVAYCSEGLSDCYSKKGDFEKSLGFYKIFKQYTDSLNKSKIQQSIFELDAQYELKLADQDKKILENQLTISEGVRKYQKLINYLVAGLALILVSILFNVLQRVKARKKAISSEKNILQGKMVDLKDQIIQKNKIINSLNSELEHLNVDEGLKFNIINDLRLERDWLNFMSKVEQMFPTFFKRLKSKSEELTNNDLRFCALIKMDLDNEQIGEVLNITLAGIKKAKQRIRKKLGIELNETLKNFLEEV